MPERSRDRDTGIPCGAHAVQVDVGPLLVRGGPRHREVVGERLRERAGWNEARNPPGVDELVHQRVHRSWYALTDPSRHVRVADDHTTTVVGLGAPTVAVDD